MSVLSFPRIYFKGYMEWDPCTFNNNDWSEFPTYDATNAALNWGFLSKQGQVPPGITPTNFTTTFRPWAIALQPDQKDQPSGPRVPCEWNMFGSHKVSFVQHTGGLVTTISGGDTAYNTPTLPTDPILGKTVGIMGDGGSGRGCLVDTNPTSPWSSQIYFGQFRFGDGEYTTTGQRVYRMHSRWLNPSRIYGASQSLTSPAASIGCCFQTGIPNNLISWTDQKGSPLINALKTASVQPGALGIMIRFTAYVNLYFMNSTFNNEPAQPTDYESLAIALAAAWEEWKTTGKTTKFFSNPCYSHIVGAIGVWNQNELASVPGGRCLNGSTAVTPVVPATMSKPVPQPALIAGHEVKPAATASTDDSVLLGPAAVNVDYNGSLISLDFSGVIPEMPGQWPNDVAKANFGTLTLGVKTTSVPFTPIATINYNQYQQSAYDAKAGIIDIPFPDSGTGKLLENGMIAIQAQGQTALLEQPYTAETDTRGIYLDQNEQGKFDVTVCQMGIPAPGVNLLVAKYEPSEVGLSLIPSNKPQLVNITNGQPVTVPIAAGVVSNAAIFQNLQNGVARVEIAPANPGFPVLAFFPYTGSTLPPVPDTFNFTNDAFFTTIRVLPFDDGVPQQFLDLWEQSNHDPNAAWNFVYNEILYVYDMLFSVMLKHVNLGSQSAVDSSAAAILSTIQKEVALESTSAMPITRDLSEGKRQTLQLYLTKVVNQ